MKQFSAVVKGRFCIFRTFFILSQPDLLDKSITNWMINRPKPRTSKRPPELDKVTSKFIRFDHLSWRCSVVLLLVGTVIKKLTNDLMKFWLHLSADKIRISLTIRMTFRTIKTISGEFSTQETPHEGWALFIDHKIRKQLLINHSQPSFPYRRSYCEFKIRNDHQELWSNPPWK